MRTSILSPLFMIASLLGHSALGHRPEHARPVKLTASGLDLDRIQKAKDRRERKLARRQKQKANS